MKLQKTLDTFIDYRYSLPLVWDDIDDTLDWFHDLFEED